MVRCLSLESKVQSLLTHTPVQRVREGLGGSHTVVTYPPLDALDALDGCEPFTLDGAPEVSVYLHIAFCEWVCKFCHYTKLIHRPGSASPEAPAYLAALEDEAAMRLAQLRGTPVRSIYVGGGTPTSLDLADLGRVLGIVRRFAAAGTKEVCVETSPITIAAEDGPDKIALLEDAGVTRLSIGVQTFDGELLPALRGHDQATVIKSVERVLTSGAMVNIDLILDLPGQTMRSVDQDLEWIAKLRPQQVTWYTLRFHEGSSMGRACRDRPSATDKIKSDIESAVRRHHVIARLAAMGYLQQPGGRFQLAGEPADAYKPVRGGLDSALLGIGVSAYSHGWGWFFRNQQSYRARVGVRDYIERIRKGSPATAWATEISPEERLAGRLCVAARSEVPDSLLAGDSATARDARTILRRLEGYGLFAKDGSSWKLTALGRLFEEEVASLFFSREMRERLWRRNAYWADRSWFDEMRGNETGRTKQTSQSDALSDAVASAARYAFAFG